MINHPMLFAIAILMIATGSAYGAADYIKGLTILWGMGAAGVGTFVLFLSLVADP